MRVPHSHLGRCFACGSPRSFASRSLRTPAAGIRSITTSQTDDAVTNTFTAKNITIENVSSSGSPRQNKSLTDLREVLSQQRLPGFFTPLTNLFWFNSYWQLTATERPTPGSTHPNSGLIRTLNEYDPSGNLMGNIARAGLDVSPTSTAQFTLASLDRIYESNIAYEKISGSWYLTATDQKYLTDNSATPTAAAIRRERVTGLGTNVRSETTLIDADNNSTLVTVTLDLANKKVTTVTDIAQSTLNATSIAINGLLQSASTPTISAPTQYFYDGLGRQVRIQNPAGFNSGTRFDTVCNQVLATTNFTGQVTSYEYYPGTHLNAGRLKAQTDADNRKSYFEYNARGELIRKWGHVPYPEERVYNNYGELTQVKSFRAGSGWSSSTWPSGTTGTADTTTNNFQESTGLLTSTVDALSNTVNYSYYTNNLLKTRFWARGTNVTYNISTLGDLTGLDFSDSTPDVTYASFDRTGRPRSLTDATGAHTLTYDHAQRLTQDTGTSGAFNGITVKNRFNAVFGRDQLKLEITSQSTIQHDFGYDTYGRLSTAGSGVYVATYSYLSGSDLLQLTTSKNNGVTKLSVQRNWEFDSRLQAIANTAITNISWDTYTFDPVNRRARTTAVDGSAWQYDYNERGELRSARRFWSDFSPVAGQQFEFTHDNIGNRSTQKEGGDANGLNLRQTSYTPNALNQYTTVNPPNVVDIIGIATATATVTVNGTTAYRKGEYYCQPLSVTNTTAPVTLPVTLTTTLGSSITQTGTVLVAKSVTSPSYDLDGNLTDDGFWTYTWDAENRLVQMESVSSIGEAAKRKLVFTYDHAGRRATKKVYLWSAGAWSGTPSVDLKLVYDGGRLLAELNPTGNAPLRSYVWGQDISRTFEGAGGIGGLVLQTHHGGSTTNFFPAYDGNGNVTALVNAADQSIAARYEYSAFGETLRATEPLAKANPIRFSSKCTDDETGLICFGARYYHPDFGRWAGRDPAGLVDGPNLYAYVSNGPVNAVDPDGRLMWAFKAVTTGLAIGNAGLSAYSFTKYWNCMNDVTELNRVARKRLDAEAFEEFRRQNTGADCAPLLDDAASGFYQALFWSGARLVLARAGYNPFTGKPWGQ